MPIIVLDPGHYEGYNPGVCPGYYEGNAMMKLAVYLGDMLSQMGATVKYTRTSNSQNPSLEERGRTGAGADMFLSLHSNAFDDPNASGVITFYSVAQPGSQPFAAEIGKATAAAMGNQFRGTETRTLPSNSSLDYYGVIRAAVAAGTKNVMLNEQGFHTNPSDCAFLNSEEGLRALADAQARAIGAYFGLQPLPGPVVPVPPAPVPPVCDCRFYYTVQPGEYLYLIAKKFGVPWQAIAAANGIEAPYIIFPGQKLIIPVPPAG